MKETNSIDMIDFVMKWKDIIQKYMYMTNLILFVCFITD